jgi:hypothetical protein
MFERLKQSLVESYVGAIALGWLFAQAILHCANIFAAPIVGWVSRSEYRRFADHSVGFPSNLMLRDSLPELAKSCSLLLLGYVLLRWLYFKPIEKRGPTPELNPEQPS